MGAYQDIMGDLHNLFGRVNEVHVFLDPDEPTGYYVEEIIEGTTIGQALASVQYDENELKRLMKVQIDESIKSDRMKPSEAMRLLDEYEHGLKEYTYLSFSRAAGLPGIVSTSMPWARCHSISNFVPPGRRAECDCR